MAYIIPLILVLIYKMLGKVIITITKLTKTKHEVVYGFFAYMSMFFVLSGFFGLLHVSWSLYYISMIIYNIFIIAIIIFCLLKKIITIKFSFKEIGTYISGNWIVYIVTTTFILLYILSYSGIRLNDVYHHAPAIIDDVVYIARATKNIGAEQIQLTSIQAFSGHVDSNPTSMIAYLEMFWGFGSTLFKVDILSFARTSMSILTYVIVFTTIDELLYVVFEKDIYDKKGKFALIGMLSLYLFNGMQFETYKFMYLPWFGNNFSTILYLPALLLFLLQALKNKVGILFILMLVLISVGFTPVSILYTAVFSIPTILLWFKCKQYEIKHEKMYICLAAMISLIFLLASTLTASFGSAPLQLQNVFKYTETTIFSEVYFYLSSFGEKAFLIFPGLLLFFYRLKNEKVNIIEKTIVIFLAVIAFVSLIPVGRNLMFNLFSFPYRRLLESILLCLVMYTVVQIILCFSKITFVKILIIGFASIIIAHYSSNIYMVGARQYFSVSNLFNTRKTAPITDTLAEYLATIPKDKYVCLMPDRVMSEKNQKFQLDIGIAISENPNAYINCSTDFLLTGNGYLVIAVNASVPEWLEDFIDEPIKKLSSDDLDLLIYELPKIY